MIRPININLNAAHPELPLVEATTFTGAPSSVFIRGVPKSVGNWSITAVNVAVTYPDNTTTARAAVESAEGVWVATVPGTATSGRTAAGFKIMADGIDENGAAVTGYVLGFADFSVLSFTPVPAPGGTFYLLRYFDQAPATPKEGDAAKIDGVLKFYNGSAWEPFAAPVTLDNTVTRTSANGVKSSGIWSAIWGALSALPTGFSSLYDWVVAQLTGKFAQYYPDGSVKSTAEFTQGIKYNAPDTVNRTITVKPFCNTGTAENDNSGLVGRVVIPPFVDGNGNGYISDDGTRFKVVGVSSGAPSGDNTNPTAIIAPNTVTDIGDYAFASCTSLTSVSLPAATRIEDWAFPFCTSLASIDFGDTPRLSVPALGLNVFVSVTNTCKIIVPYTQYDEWKAATGWKDLPQEFVRHAEKADKPETFTEGNLAKFDASGNPVDSGKKPSDFQSTLTPTQLANIAAVSDALAFDSTHSYAAGDPVVYNDTLYTFTAAHTGAWTGSDVSAVDIIARLAGKLDKSGGTVTGDLEVDYAANGFTVKDSSGNYLQIRHGTAAGDFWYVNYYVANVGSGSLRLPYDNVIPANLYSLADQFNPSTTYAQNSLCIDYSHGVLYRCTNPNGHTGPWVDADFAVATVEDVLAALRTGKADVSAIPYSLGTPTVIDTASSETVEGETVYYGAATLANRTANIVQVTAATALDELRITFPAATSGKVRDFGLRVEIGTGSAALSAPALVPIAPTGETIKIENADGTIPALADGTATAKGVTLLYFSETASGVFVVKGEQVEEVA